MKIAIMQPYIFPYIGYYQLVYSVDTFVFYDDVNFINRGYVNRNNILVNGEVKLFTVPLVKASQNKKILDINCQENVSKVIKTIHQSYSKAPYFNAVMPIVEKVLTSENRNLSYISVSSIKTVFEYLGIEKKFILSSSLTYDRSESAAGKLISICKLFNSDNYINSIGGVSLYNKDYFSLQGINLEFIKKENTIYTQCKNDFIDNLSMLDVMMWCSKEDVIKLLGQYRMI